MPIHDTAADLLQDTFLRALVAFDPVQPPSHLPAWLYRIATNLALNTLRRRRRWRWLPFQTDAVAVGFEGAVVQSQLIRNCLAQLRPKEAETLLLYEYVGLTSVEIAKLTGEKPSTVRVRLSRASTRFCRFYDQESQP
ncbi:MAG: RNA polymerase sigma factor [Chloroflexota bacterium]